MANLAEVSQWESGTYQIELTDDVIGGPAGISNKQGITLGNRTRFLYDRLKDSGINYAADTGTLNAIVANVPAAPTAWADGAEYRFKAANSVTGACTFTPNNAGGGLAPVPVLAGDHAATQGGEIVAGGSVKVRYVASLTSVVIIESTNAIVRAAKPAIGDASSALATMSALFDAADGMAAVNVASGTDVTLTKAQYGKAMLNLTGTPTANINLIFPAQTGHFVVRNQQGGAFNVTAKTASGVGVVLPQGVAVIIYCDGTDIGLASASGTASLRAIPITGVTGSTLTVSGGYTVGAILIEKNGTWLPLQDFTATNGATVGLTTPAISTDKFNIYAFATFTVANAVLKSGDTMAGPLTLSGNAANPLEAVPKQQLDAAVLAQTHVRKRQTIMAGAAQCLQIGTGLAVNLLAAAVPVVVTYPGGIGASGYIDYIGQFSADLASFWSGLTANTTNYLFVDRNTTTGAQTGIASTLPYIARKSDTGAPSTTNGQHTYYTDTGVMYVGNGSTATAVQRTAFGECVTGASTVTSVATYTKNREFDTGVLSTTISATVSAAHNLGVLPDHFDIWLSLSGTNRSAAYFFYTGSYSGVGVYGVTRTQMQCRTQGNLQSTAAGSGIGGSDNNEIQVIITTHW